MTKGSPLKLILKFMIPVIIGSLFQQIMLDRLSAVNQLRIGIPMALQNSITAIWLVYRVLMKRMEKELRTNSSGIS